MEDSADKLRDVSSSSNSDPCACSSHSVGESSFSNRGFDLSSLENSTLEECQLDPWGASDPSMSQRSLQNSSLWNPTMGQQSSSVLLDSTHGGAWGMDSQSPYPWNPTGQAPSTSNSLSYTGQDWDHIPPAAIRHVASSSECTVSGQVLMPNLSTQRTANPNECRNTPGELGYQFQMQIHRERIPRNREHIQGTIQEPDSTTGNSFHIPCMSERAGDILSSRGQGVSQLSMLGSNATIGTVTEGTSGGMYDTNPHLSNLQNQTPMLTTRFLSQNGNATEDEGVVPNSNFGIGNDDPFYYYNDFGNIDPSKFLTQRVIEKYLREQELFSGFFPRPFDSNMFQKDKKEVNDLYVIKREIKSLEYQLEPLTKLSADHIGSQSYIIKEVKVDSGDASILVDWPQKLQDYVLTGLARTLYLQHMRDIIKFTLLDQKFWEKMKEYNKAQFGETAEQTSWRNFWRRRASHMIDENWRESTNKGVTSSDLKRLQQGDCSQTTLTRRLLEIQYLLKNPNVDLIAVPSVYDRMQKKAQDLLASH